MRLAGGILFTRLRVLTFCVSPAGVAGVAATAEAGLEEGGGEAGVSSGSGDRQRDVC